MVDRFSTACCLSLAVLVLAGAQRSFGQTGTVQQRLANATRLDCRFSVLTTGSWEDDTPSATVAPVEFEASFFDIDIVGGTAEADGRFGSSYIVVRYSGEYLHLMQMIDIGPLYLTTVLAKETKPGRLMAIHTRHEYVASRYPEFAERPEMYLGDCAVQ